MSVGTSRNLRQVLKQAVEQTDTPAGQTFNWLILLLILYSALTLSIETLPDLSPGWRRFLGVSEVVVTSIFTLEYLIRLYTADNRLRYVFSFYGLSDLIAILPFYLSLGIDLRSIRIFRLLRVFRLLKLSRYNKALHRFARAFAIAREEIILFSCVALAVIYVSAVGIYYFEHEAQPDKFSSVFHSLWWSVATLTTVGYGDVYPVTVGGKIFTFVVLTAGLGIVAVPTGLIASALVKAREEEK
jgi:voltage-gated potassium channel